MIRELRQLRCKHRNECGAYRNEGLSQRWLNAYKVHCLLFTSYSGGRVMLKNPTWPVLVWQRREE